MEARLATCLVSTNKRFTANRKAKSHNFYYELMICFFSGVFLNRLITAKLQSPIEIKNTVLIFKTRAVKLLECCLLYKVFIFYERLNL